MESKEKLNIVKLKIIEIRPDIRLPASSLTLPVEIQYQLFVQFRNYDMSRSGYIKNFEHITS